MRFSRLAQRFSVFGSSAFLGLSLVACGGGAPAPEAPTPSKTEPTAAPSESKATAQAEPAVDGPSPIPTACHKEDGEFCTAPPRWVKKLCSDIHPDVALSLFHPKSPFTHGFLTRRTKAVNASGGVTGGEEYLAFDEEVVLLVHRGGDSGGIQVSGAEGGFDAIRWDGSCVTLDSTEVTTRKPPQAKHGRLDWRYFGEETQDTLKANDKIREAFIARKKECKGAYSGDVSKLCVQKDEALMNIIVETVKSGGVQLPEPKKRP